MRTLVSWIIFLAMMVALAMFASPYYKLYTFKSAYDAGDYTPIIGSINFDTLRPNLKRQLHAKVDNIIATNDLVPVLSLVGVGQGELKNFGVRYVDTAIDKAITKDNLTALAQGQLTKDSEPLLAGVAVATGLVDMPKLAKDYLSTGDISQAIESQKTDIAKKATAFVGTPSQPVLSYCGINCFSVATTIKERPITVMMSRVGLVEWQIDNVILP